MPRGKEALHLRNTLSDAERLRALAFAHLPIRPHTCARGKTKEVPLVVLPAVHSAVRFVFINLDFFIWTYAWTLDLHVPL